MNKKTGSVAVMLALAIIVIALLAMISTHIAGWSAWALLVVAAIIVGITFAGFISAQAHFAVLFGVIGAIIVVLAVVIKIIKMLF